MQEQLKDMNAKDTWEQKPQQKNGLEEALAKRAQQPESRRESTSRGGSPEQDAQPSLTPQLDALIDRAKRRYHENPPKRRHQKIFKFVESLQEEKCGLENLADLFEKDDPFEEKQSVSQTRLSDPDVTSKEAFYKIFHESLTDLVIIKKA